jgi:hypothetical protein
LLHILLGVLVGLLLIEKGFGYKKYYVVMLAKNGSRFAKNCHTKKGAKLIAHG